MLSSPSPRLLGGPRAVARGAAAPLPSPSVAPPRPVCGPVCAQPTPRRAGACRRRRASAGHLCRAAAALPSTPPAAPVTARWLLNIKFGSRAEAAALLAEWIATIALPAGLSPGCARVLAGAVGAPDGRLELELRLASISALEALWAALPAPTHRAWGERLARHIEGSPRWEVFYELPSGGGGSAPTAAATAVASPAREGLRPPPAVSPPPPPPAQPPSVGSAPLTAGGVAVVSAADVDAILAWSDGPGAPAAGSGRARSGDVFIPPPGSPPSFPSQPPPTAVGSRAADDTPFGRSGGDGGASDGDEENLTLGPRPDGSRVVLDWKGDFMIVRPGDNLPGL